MSRPYTEQNSSADPPPSRLTWAIYALVLGAVSALFFADLRHLLLGVDDAGAFRDHLAINRDFLFFFSPDKERASGRLVDEFITWSVHLISGNNPAVFHLLIAFVHGLASWSLAVCFRRLGVGLVASLSGGLLFLVNIAHVGTVHWISALEYPLAVFNSAWTLYFFARYIESGRQLFYGLFYVGLTLCIFTHFVTVLLWPLCFFYVWFNSANFRASARSLLFLLPALALALTLVFFTTGSDTTTQSAFDFYRDSTSKFASLFTFASDSLQVYLWLLGRLVSMAHWLPFAPNVEHPVEVWLGILLLLALLVVLWKGSPSIQFCSAWTLLFLVPFVPATLVHTGIARYLYIASAGSSLLLAWALSSLADRLGRKGPYVLALMLLLIVWSSYRAEERVANITRYNSGRYYITNDDPQIGVELLQNALATDPAFLPLGEAYLSLLQGLLISGQDYAGVLKTALEEVPEDHSIQLVGRISDVLIDRVDHAADPEVLSVLYGDSYTHIDSAFAHTASVLSQHFGSWYAKRGDGDGTIRSYRLSLRADPQNINTAQSLIKLLLQSGNYGEAVKTVEALRGSQVDNPRLLYLTALSYKFVGRSQEALAIVRRAQQLAPSANLHILEGDLLLEKGLMADAETAYRRAIAVGSTSPEPFLQIAYIHYQQGRIDLALKTLEDAPAPMQEYAIIQNNLGHIYYAEGRAEDAVMAYQRAVSIDSKYTLAYSNLGTVLRSLGRLDEAEQAYRRAVQLEVDNPLLHEKLGRLLVEANNSEAAMGELAKAAELGVANFSLYLTLGQLYLEGNEREKALATHRFIMRHTWPTARADDYAGVGANLHALGQVDAAFEAYRRALALDQTNPPTHINLGWLLYEQGKYREAIEHYVTALEYQPNATAQFNMGLAYMARGDFAAARRIYAQGVERFGATEAQRVGAVDDLRALIAKTPSAIGARQLLDEFWPQ